MVCSFVPAFSRGLDCPRENCRPSQVDLTWKCPLKFAVWCVLHTQDTWWRIRYWVILRSAKRSGNAGWPPCKLLECRCGWWMVPLIPSQVGWLVFCGHNSFAGFCNLWVLFLLFVLLQTLITCVTTWYMSMPSRIFDVFWDNLNSPLSFMISSGRHVVSRYRTLIPAPDIVVPSVRIYVVYTLPPLIFWNIPMTGLGRWHRSLPAHWSTNRSSRCSHRVVSQHVGCIVTLPALNPVRTVIQIDFFLFLINS